MIADRPGVFKRSGVTLTVNFGLTAAWRIVVASSVVINGEVSAKHNPKASRSRDVNAAEISLRTSSHRTVVWSNYFASVYTVSHLVFAFRRKFRLFFNGIQARKMKDNRSRWYEHGKEKQLGIKEGKWVKCDRRRAGQRKNG